MENLAEVVTKNNVTKALNEILKKKIKLIPSTKFDLIYNGYMFPPKEVVRLAAEIQGIKDIENYRLSGGKNTNSFLIDKGFEIVNKNSNTDPVLDLIEQYKQRVKKNKLENEIYKWKLLNDFQGRPNVDSPNFTEEILSINFSNLIYPVGIGVVHHIAREKPEEYRVCFKILFDISLELKERISEFSDLVLKIYREMGVEERFSHHHDERTCATFLTYHNPYEYAFYKDSFYQKYCKLINEAPKRRGEKYVHYLGLIDELIESYIVVDTELLNLVSSLLPPGSYTDDNHKLLAQDILYQMFDASENGSKKYWRIGTKDEEGNYWEVMKSNNYASIGWKKLGDLSDFVLDDKRPIQSMMEEMGEYMGNKSVISRKAGEIFDFIKTIKEGDVILAQDGNRVLGIGVVNDDYGFDEGQTFPHFRQVEWKLTNIDNFFSEEGKLTSVCQIKDFKTIAKIENFLNEAKPMNKINISSKNVILFGPPGTGKTYKSIDLSVQLADGNSFETHQENKSRFDELRKNGRIEFITFHQNYSYEDFIVGISPDVASGELRFKRNEGVFKQLCEKAKSNYISSINPSVPNITFEHVFNYFFSKLIQEEVQEVSIPMKAKGYSFRITSIDTDEGRMKFTKQSGGTGHDLLIKNVKAIYEGTLDYGYDGLGVYYHPLVDKLKEEAIEIADSTQETEQLQNYVLIIDEINRANISRVFGELITLLEDDKRIGEKNELRVTLPNGEKEFGVPPNLYILGTMNTADKSIALVDIALRRRFEFIGFYPDYTLPELDPAAVTLLQHINKAVYIKKGSVDYLIGHAYFLNNTSIDNVIKNKVIPLLMEYFSGKTDIVAGLFDESNWKVGYDKETYSWNIKKSIEE